ncbi:MAG TPA: hypothetical protein VNX26_01950 [Candidatus Acidoferrum sp.]|jgi:hypothetical protein|nr:hypothetical protein [Candidatus Acidoferrum sp.]
MIRRKISPFVPVGMLALAASSIVRRYLHGNHWDFANGLLMGVSIGLMIVGVVRQSRNMAR